MSDTVKLIIEIPKESYEYIKTLSEMGCLTSPEYSNATRLTSSEFVNAIRNGTPMEDVTAEIKALQKTYPFVNHIDTYVKEDDVLHILDNIGKESETN